MSCRVVSIVLLLLTAACPSAAKTGKPPPAAPPSSQPATAPASQPGAGPFARLRVVTPPGKLPPLRSVRVRDKREEQDRSRKGNVRISISSRPKAAVYYGGRVLGKTPLTLTATWYAIG